MNRRIAAPAAVVIIGGSTLVVLGYNFWSYCCGRCSAATFLTLGPFGRTLLGLNLVAAGVLLFLKLRRRSRWANQRCRCGATLAADWTFCPFCGPSDTAGID